MVNISLIQLNNYSNEKFGALKDNVDIHNDGKVIWSRETDNIEILAGMLAVGLCISYDLNQKNPNKVYIFSSETDVRQYRLLSYIPISELTHRSSNILHEGEYGLWLISDIPYYYHLYRFTEPEFIQGMLFICDYFKMEIREYVYGVPFDLDGNHYYIPNRLNPTYNYNIQAPDFYDTDEERHDDENVLEPLNPDMEG